MSSSKKLDYLDSLRGIASIIVVISHITLLYFPYLHNFGDKNIPNDNYIQLWIHNSPFGFFYSGSAAVYVFFVMSGIVLSLSASKKNINLTKSITSRYIRLAIPASTSCIFAYISIVFISTNIHTEINNFFNDSLNINNPTLLNSFYYGAIRSIFYLRGTIEYNPVLWTMAIEFYGSVCLYIAYKTKKPLFTMLIISIMFSFINLNVFIGIFCFFIGMLLSSLIKKDINLKNNIQCLALLIVGLYFAGVHNNSNSYTIITNIIGDNTYTILNSIAGVLIVISIITNENIKHFLSNKYVNYLGKLSFPIYLTHWSIIFIFSNILPLMGIKSLPVSIIIITTSVISFSFIFIYIDKMAITLSKVIKK